MMRKKVLFVVAGVVALLTVPVVGTGQTTFSVGGPPTVYTQTHPEDICAELSFGGTTVMDQQLQLDSESNLVVYFFFKLGSLSPRETAGISFGLDGDDTDQEWPVNGSSSTTSGPFGTSQSATLMWTFDHVPAGDHSVQAFARVVGGSDRATADLNACALTVLVSPTIS